LLINFIMHFKNFSLKIVLQNLFNLIFTYMETLMVIYTLKKSFNNFTKGGGKFSPSLAKKIIEENLLI